MQERVSRFPKSPLQREHSALADSFLIVCAQMLQSPIEGIFEGECSKDGMGKG